jgi:glycosyltransferase involved in cell wall biosynthesis
MNALANRMRTVVKRVGRKIFTSFESHDRGLKTMIGERKALMRVLVIANGNIPTVQLSILVPLQKLIQSKKCAVAVVTEQQLKERYGKQLRSDQAWTWLRDTVIAFDPTSIVFCRYSGPHSQELIALAHERAVATIYCIDDDLLNVPLELGPKKFEFHNHPLRLAAVNSLLRECALVYCSNDRLRDRLANLPGLSIQGKLVAAEIFCAAQVIAPAVRRECATIGYMGFDHAHDFAIAVPAVVTILQTYPNIRFELFGKIPKPPELAVFGSRIVELPPVESYEAFLQVLAGRSWDIGIAPLAKTDFNLVKNINKWIEYSAAGVAMVGSVGLIYDECCADGCGVVCDDSQWLISLDKLVRNPDLRFALVRNAQERLVRDYSIDRLTDQLLNVFDQAVVARRTAAHE